MFFGELKENQNWVLLEQQIKILKVVVKVSEWRMLNISTNSSTEVL